MEGLVKGLPVGRDTCSAVFQRRRRVVSWCVALTTSHSSNIHNKLTEVGGVFSVVIHRYKCLFCKLGSNLQNFTRREMFCLWQLSGQTAEWNFLQKIIISHVHFIKSEY